MHPDKINEIMRSLKKILEPNYQKISADDILHKALTVQEIPAPTFEENERAEFFEAVFHTNGLYDIKRDELKNVIGWLKPYSHDTDDPIILISAHSDTVFPHETDLTSEKRDGRVYGPGIGDNSLGTAAVWQLIEQLRDIQMVEDINNVGIGLVINSREEGLGNLDGMRAIIESLPHERLKACIVIEAMAIGRVYHSGIAVRRLEISTQAAGGHSWLHFGQASAIHELVKICAEICRIEVPQEPRTTFNIGMIHGGQSVNSIATSALCYLDMRSTTSEGLAELEVAVRTVLKDAQAEGFSVEVKTIGDRPAGTLDTNHWLVEYALAAQRAVSIDATLEQGSTDANIILAKGIPAVVVGITQGGNAHRLDEFIETEPIHDGFWSLLLLTVATIQRLSQS